MSMGKFLDIIIKICAVVLVVFILYCCTIGREFGIKQIHKVEGMYYVNQGDKAFKKNDMQNAISYYIKGLELYPEHYKAWLNLGNIYVAYEDYYSATQAYENAIKAKHDYTLARMNLGIITAEKLGNFDDAIYQYQKIIASKPFMITIPFIYDNKRSEVANKAIAYYNMGKAYSQKAVFLPPEMKIEKKELMEKSAWAYENSVRIVKDNYNMYYNLALTYHLLGDYRKAGQNYCNAIDVMPMNYEAHYNLGLLLKHLHEETYAIDELEKAAVLSTSEDSSHSKYIFDVLSSLSMLAIQKGIPDKIADLQKETEKLKLRNSKEAEKQEKKENKNNEMLESSGDEEVTLINGKITVSDDNEKATVDAFKKCNSRKLFELN